MKPTRCWTALIVFTCLPNDPARRVIHSLARVRRHHGDTSDLLPRPLTLLTVNPFSFSFFFFFNLLGSVKQTIHQLSLGTRDSRKLICSLIVTTDQTFMLTVCGGDTTKIMLFSIPFIFNCSRLEQLGFGQYRVLLPLILLEYSGTLSIFSAPLLSPSSALTISYPSSSILTVNHAPALLALHHIQ